MPIYPWTPQGNESAKVWKKPAPKPKVTPWLGNTGGMGGTPDWKSKKYPDQTGPSPSWSHRLHEPEGWDKVMYPTTGAWGEYRRNNPPPADLTYWQNPLNVARAYHSMKSAPPGTPTPEFLPREDIEAAYKYMVERQGTDDWVNWKYLNDADPANYWLANMQAPPMEWQLKPEDFQVWHTADLQMRDPDTWTDEDMSKIYDPQLREGFLAWRDQWANKTPYEDLPTWRKMTDAAMANPIMNGLSTMVPFAAAGAVGGMATGGPIGALIGGGVPLAMGAGLGALSNVWPTAAELLTVLDVPAQEVEEIIGLGIQIEGAMIDEEQYGTIEEIMADLDAAKEAGGMAYESGAFTQAVIGGFLQSMGAGNPEELLNPEYRLDITNIFPAIEYGWKTLLDEDTSNIEFAKSDEVFPELNVVTDSDGERWVLSGANPIELDSIGATALVDIRRRLVNGEPVEQVLDEAYQEFGLSGQLTDLIGHMALDPLNVMPKVTSKGVGVVAHMGGNFEMANAFLTTESPIHGWKKYKTFIREGLTGAADETTAFTRFVGALNDEGVIKEMATERPKLPWAFDNPIGRWTAHLVDLTPEARARGFIAMSSDNIMNMAEHFKGDPEGFAKTFKMMINESPTKMAEVAKVLGSPEWATTRQAIAGYGVKLDELLNVWENHADHRRILNTLAEDTGLDQKTIIKLSQDAKTSDALLTMLKDKVSATGDPAKIEIANNAKVGDLRQIMEAFGGDNPAMWHPDEFSARVYSSFGEHVARWTIDAFGVEKPGQVQRFWNTLKRAQSVVLLGYNPAYAINNIVNNTVTRAATGIWGYASPAKIDAFWKDFGYKPYRASDTLGIGQELGQAAKDAQPGEAILRQAVTDTKRPGVVTKGIDFLGKFGFSTTISAAAEGMERNQSQFFGTKKYMDQNWRAGKGFQTWSNDVRQAMKKSFPDIENIDRKVYAIIEGSPNKSVAQRRINDFLAGKGPVHDFDIAMDSVAHQMGVDPGTMRDGLSWIEGPLKEKLENAVTAEEIANAYAEARADLVNQFVDQISADLKTRFEQVANQTRGGGFAEAARIFTDAQIQSADFWINDLMSMQEMIDQAWSIREAGGSYEQVNSIYRKHNAERNKSWQAHRRFERSTWLGFLEAMGAEGPEARAFLKGVDEGFGRWDDYYAMVEERRTTHFATEFENKAQQKAAWIRMENEMTDEYMKVIRANDVTQAAIDDIFVRQSRAMYGDEAATAAKQWRERMRAHQIERAEMMTAHRRRSTSMSAERRRLANEKFYNDKYIPYIKNSFRSDVELSNFYNRTVNQDVPKSHFEGVEDVDYGPIYDYQQPTEPAPGYFITTSMRDRLELMGYTADEINNMRPRQAWDTIRARQGMGAPPPPTVEAPPAPEPVRPVEQAPVPEKAPEVQSLDEVYAVADEAGIPSATDDGFKNDIEILREFNTYGDKRVSSLADVTPEQLRDMFDAKERATAQIEMEDSSGLPPKLGEENLSTASRIQKQARENYRSTQSQKIVGNYIEGSISDLPDHIQAGLRVHIEKMMSEFTSGRGDNVVPMYKDDGSQFFIKKSDNAQWYADLYNESKKNRSTIVKTLQRMLTGGGDYRTGDVPRAKWDTLRKLKEQAWYRMAGDVDDLYGMEIPGQPGYFLYMGDEAQALSTFKEHLEAFPELLGWDEAELGQRLALDPEGLEQLFKLWDEEISGSMAKDTDIVPVEPELPSVGDELVALYLTKMADILDLKELAEQVTGLNSTAIVPVGEQGLATRGPGQVEVFSNPATRPHGDVPPGVVEDTMPPEYRGNAGFDYYNNRMSGWLDAMQTQAMEDVRYGAVQNRNIDVTTTKKLNSWLKGVYSDMSAHKMAAVRYGETLADEALLNYSRKRNFDNSIQWLYPYQYWYTRSGWQWAQRMIDRPAWFANYSRLNNLMEKNQNRAGFPSRLRGKFAIPAPYLPEWAGGNLWVDPLRKLLPIEEWATVNDQMARNANNDARSAQYWLKQQYDEGQIDQQAVIQAITEKQGPTWEMAMAEIHKRNEEEKAHPESLATMLMSPAMYLTYPYALITGTDPTTGMEPTQWPITRTGAALQTALKDTGGQWLGDVIGGIMSAPEKYIRGWRGMNEFGGWGDYYIDRQIVNMVNERKYSSREGQIAMNERGDNPIYQEAVERVRFEQMLKVPGGAALYAGTHGADLANIMSAVAFGWMPANLLPDGELRHRGLKEQYDMARQKMNAGDHSALQEFYDEYPEYEARTALYKEPEERFRQFMISDLWDTYGELGSVDKQEVQKQLGPDFERLFLHDETGTYEGLDNETIGYWLRAMGRDIPQTQELQRINDIPDLDMQRIQYANPNDVALVDTYKNNRNTLFPNWYAMQQMYYALPKGGGTLPGATPEENAAVLGYRSDRNSMFPGWFEMQSQYFQLPQGQRSGFLKANPQLADYWDWSRAQKKANPAIEKFAGVRREGGPRAEFLQQFPELGSYWDWNKAVKSENPQIDYYMDPDRDDREPPIAAQYNMDWVRDFTPGLTRQLFDYYYTGEPMSEGAIDELITGWDENYQPGDDYDYFFNELLRKVVAP